MGIVVTDVGMADLPAVWERVKGMLAEAADRNQGEFTLEDVRLGLERGMMSLWIAYVGETGLIHAAAVCEIRNFPQRKICYIILMAGDGFKDWHWAIGMIEDWAIANGADALAAYTRRGFMKTMKNYGYAEVYTVIQRELTARRLH